ncbi:MAG TPA: substrate-binding domain-containing protein [Anaeromyxobacteraceae bacterium]|nr:substrate-binding domain-containing protein [Anaeromyxobacteraceae bacterium]
MRMKRKSWKRTTVAAAVAALALWAGAAAAGQVRLHGATTVVDRVINTHRDAVERTTGHTLEVTGNATGKGLVDLHEGRCDASLSSEPVEIAVAAAAAAGRQVDRAKLQFHVVANDQIVFVVHPSNPVTSLTWEQIRDIHTGKIRNWREVGGKDQPITVFSDTPTGGTRAMIKATVMGGKEYASSVVALTAVRKVADMVAADPTGFGGLGKGFADSRTKVVQTRVLERPLGFLTIGAPSPAVKAIIDAFKAEAAKK